MTRKRREFSPKWDQECNKLKNFSLSETMVCDRNNTKRSGWEATCGG